MPLLSRVSIPALFYSAIHQARRNAGLSFSHPVNARLKRGAPLRLRPAHAGLAAHCVTHVVRYSGGISIKRAMCSNLSGYRQSAVFVCRWCVTFVVSCVQMCMNLFRCVRLYKFTGVWLAPGCVWTSRFSNSFWCFKLIAFASENGWKLYPKILDNAFLRWYLCSVVTHHFNAARCVPTS